MTPEDLKRAWSDYGETMRGVRQLLGFSIREVAEKSGVSKNTVTRLESGLPVHRNSILSICKFYNCTPVDPTMMKPSSSRGAHYRFQSRADEVWYPLRVNKEGSVEQILDKDVSDARERERMGRLGLADFFNLPIRCRRENSKMIPFIMEIYRKTDDAADLSGERFIYALRGDIRVNVGNESFVLSEGEGAMIESTLRHSFEPVEPADERSFGAQVLQVVHP